MSKGLLKVLLLFLVLSGIRKSYAQDILLKDNTKSYALSHPLFLIDADNTISADQLSEKNFKPSKFPTLSLGATTASVWVKIRIQTKAIKPAGTSRSTARRYWNRLAYIRKRTVACLRYLQEPPTNPKPQER